MLPKIQKSAHFGLGMHITVDKYINNDILKILWSKKIKTLLYHSVW